VAAGKEGEKKEEQVLRPVGAEKKKRKAADVRFQPFFPSNKNSCLLL